MNFYRPTWAEIDLGALRHNVNEIRKILNPDTKILAMVKADAYGHGVVEIVQTLQEESDNSSVSMLGVALIEEGVQLRQAGFNNIPILILGSIYPFENFIHVVKYDLTATICSFESARSLAKIARNSKKRIKIHIEIDTGMGRIGISTNNAISVIQKIVNLDSIEIGGIYTHFPSADTDPDFTEKQISDFNKLLRKLEELKINIPVRHMANSAAILKDKTSHLNLVRPGLALYGLRPFSSVLKYVDLKPVLQLKTRIVYLKKVPPATSISYGRTFITKRDSVIATISIGYGDGYNRLLSNKGEVLIRGNKVPVVGRICMDMCMIDVTDIPKIVIGDEVVLIGKQGTETIVVEDIADKIGTISYEVVCGITKRVPRVYLNKR